MKLFAYIALTTQALRLRYDEAEGPTKADFGEADETVAFRHDPSWVNPLSLTDNGDDDDQVLDMQFKPLDEPYEKFTLPQYELDEDIVDSLESEGDSKKYVTRARAHQKKEEAKLRRRQKEHEEKAAAREAEEAKKRKQANKKPQEAETFGKEAAVTEELAKNKKPAAEKKVK